MSSLSELTDAFTEEVLFQLIRETSQPPTLKDLVALMAKQYKLPPVKTRRILSRLIKNAQKRRVVAEYNFRFYIMDKNEGKSKQSNSSVVQNMKSEEKEETFGPIHARMARNYKKIGDGNNGAAAKSFEAKARDVGTETNGCSNDGAVFKIAKVDDGKDCTPSKCSNENKRATSNKVNRASKNSLKATFNAAQKLIKSDTVKNVASSQKKNLLKEVAPEDVAINRFLSNVSRYSTGQKNQTRITSRTALNNILMQSIKQSDTQDKESQKKDQIRKKAIKASVKPSFNKNVSVKNRSDALKEQKKDTQLACSETKVTFKSQSNLQFENSNRDILKDPTTAGSSSKTGSKVCKNMNSKNNGAKKSLATSKILSKNTSKGQNVAKSDLDANANPAIEVNVKNLEPTVSPNNTKASSKPSSRQGNAHKKKNSLKVARNTCAECLEKPKNVIITMEDGSNKVVDEIADQKELNRKITINLMLPTMNSFITTSETDTRPTLSADIDKLTNAESVVKVSLENELDCTIDPDFHKHDLNHIFPDLSNDCIEAPGDEDKNEDSCELQHAKGYMPKDDDERVFGSDLSSCHDDKSSSDFSASKQPQAQDHNSRHGLNKQTRPTRKRHSSAERERFHQIANYYAAKHRQLVAPHGTDFDDISLGGKKSSRKAKRHKDKREEPCLFLETGRKASKPVLYKMFNHIEQLRPGSYPERAQGYLNDGLCSLSKDKPETCSKYRRPMHFTENSTKQVIEQEEKHDVELICEHISKSQKETIEKHKTRIYKCTLTKEQQQKKK